jgi:hypothetical protein
MKLFHLLPHKQQQAVRQFQTASRRRVPKKHIFVNYCNTHLLDLCRQVAALEKDTLNSVVYDMAKERHYPALVIRKHHGLMELAVNTTRGILNKDAKYRGLRRKIKTIKTIESKMVMTKAHKAKVVAMRSQLKQEYALFLAKKKAKSSKRTNRSAIGILIDQGLKVFFTPQEVKRPKIQKIQVTGTQRVSAAKGSSGKDAQLKTVFVKRIVGWYTTKVCCSWDALKEWALSMATVAGGKIDGKFARRIYAACSSAINGKFALANLKAGYGLC